MTKEEYLKELDKAFGDFKFFENGHYYEYKGQRVGISVTALIGQYVNEFDSQTIAERVAQKENRPVEEILAEWKYKADFACEKGSQCHQFAQSLWSGEQYLWSGYQNNLYDYEEFSNKCDYIFEQARQFYEDYQDKLEHLADEYIIGSSEYDIASAIDHLFINKLTGGLVLVDYKTNSYLSGYNKKAYSKKMKVPLQHLNDDALHHYYIQLSIYKYIVEKYTDLVIEDMFIVYMSENIEKYEIIDIPYLKNEVEKILENRRCKNMNSVPVLLIGASGSGKSTSLRNFTREEVAVVNVLGKPLPFKSDIKAPKCDDYATILKAIANTKKKTIVIDDANYLITNEFMNKSSVKGFDKYNEMGNNFFNLINGIKNIKGGKTVYLIMHEDTDDNGNVKPKTIGKLLDDKVNIQGMFTICIRSMFDNGNYIFRLRTNGQDCVKTPFGMFENETMENDLKAFDKVVREYYELDKEESEEEK
jgi:hypothetical protein